jgi:hypothetical protein
MKIAIKSLIFLFFIIGYFSVTAMIVRNIHHPFFSSIKDPIIFIADIPKELYREFVSRKETNTPRLPSSVVGTVFDHKKIPNSFIYIYDNAVYHGKNKIKNIPPESSLIYISPNFDFYYSQEGPDIVKYKIDNNSSIELWRRYLPFVHHEIYIDNSGFLYLPIYYPNDGSDDELSKDAKKLFKILANDNSPPYGEKGDNFRDDGVAILSPEGKIIHKLSLTKLFSKNNMLELIYSSGLETDPFHLNSVFPVLNDFGVFKKGDLLLSLRHQSMLLIYRPSTLEIIWHKIGPWSNQHSAKFDRNGNIYLFDNRVIDTHYNRRSELSYIDEKNKILLHNISSDYTTEIDNCVNEKEFSTVTGGYVLFKDNYIISRYRDTRVQVICDTVNNQRLIIVPKHKDDGKVIDDTELKILGFSG